MSTSGEAADQVVRMTLGGVEVAAKLSGAAAKQIAVMLYAILKDQKKTRGKMRLSNMLRSGRELKVFAVKDQDLQRFCTEAKKYGVLYCVLRDTKAKDGITDIMVRAEDASKINRIFERFNLATVDMAAIKTEIEKTKIKGTDIPEPELTTEKDKDEKFLDELMKKPSPAKEEAQTQNPTEGRNAKSRQSEPTSKPKEKFARGTSDAPERSCPSVRAELNEIKAQQKQKAETLREEPTQERSKQKKTPQHKAPPKKKPKTKSKER